MNASLLTISAPPAGRSPMFVLSAAGFIATSTSGASPGVWISVELKLIWNPLTPGSEPAGARISAGKSGQGADVVAEDGGGPGELGPGQLHAVAGIAGEADRDPLELLGRELGLPGGRHAPSGSFMRWCGRGGRLSSSSGNDSARYLMMSFWRTTPTRWPDVVDERHVAVAAGLHELDRVADRLVEVERARLGGHSDLDRLVEVDVAADDAAEDVALGQHAEEAAVGVADEHRIAGPGALDRAQAIGEAGARRDGHGVAAAEHAQSLVGQGWDATGDHAFGEVGHARSVDRPCARWLRAGSLATHGSTVGRGHRPGGDLGGRLRIGLDPCRADLLDRRRLADARELAVPDRGRPRLAVGPGLAGSAGRVARDDARRQVAVALALGALFVGNAGTYYAGLETVPAALAGVVVYTYPVMVAVLSLRFATRLPGPRPWIAAGLAVAGSALALGGIDVAAAPPVSGLVLVFASAVIYSVWIILSARLSGERRDRLASESSADGSPSRPAMPRSRRP